MKFAIVNKACPLLNTEKFAEVFTHPLPLNSKGFLSAVEMIALPRTPLRVLEQKSAHVFQVAFETYPEQTLFADHRFLQEVEQPFVAKKIPPRKTELFLRLKNMIGLPYIWGGNWHRGVPDLLEFYPPPCALSCMDQKKWALQGVDCSGLLYEVTRGYTPRNTSQLVRFGKPVAMESIQPLDLIVWVGHVVIVLDKETTIESSWSRGGVVISDLKTRLSEIIKERETSFSVRRWV